MMNLTCACSWSSGKDSCYALYKAIKEGYQVKYLFNFISFEYSRVSFHGIKDNLVHLQAEALGIPLIQKQTTKENYEEVFRNTLKELKSLGINQIIRGDIYLQDLYDWVENICNSEGLKVISPLWKKSTDDILRGFVKEGFKAIVTCVDAKKLDESWVGRIIDEDFIKELKEIKEVDLCGEKGEYHSFVYAGPIFKKRINITKFEKVLINGFWFLDIKEFNF